MVNESIINFSCQPLPTCASMWNLKASTKSDSNKDVHEMQCVLLVENDPWTFGHLIRIRQLKLCAKCKIESACLEFFVLDLLQLHHSTYLARNPFHFKLSSIFRTHNSRCFLVCSVG